MISPLSAPEREIALSRLLGWVYDTDKKALYLSLNLPDFCEAFGLMTRIALEAEKLGHHPEWFNVYGTLQIWLQTHDADNAVSELDVELATRINGFL